jgi:hypothetical protein
MSNGVAGMVDSIFVDAKAAAPAIFSLPSNTKINRNAKLEHLIPFLALQTLHTTPHQSRAVLEEFLDRLDIGLREAGVGEMKVGVEIRTYAAALNGRLQRYKPLMEAADWPNLATALAEHGVSATVAKNLQKSLAKGV